tara:strand:+ start:599 stop:919 length:321 start_codon:yes stop_codon:yes gene_type:complete
MKQSYAILALALMMLIPLNANAEEPRNRLTCKKLNSPLVHSAPGLVRPFCNPAEIVCRAMDFLQERPKDDKFRLEVEPELKRDMLYRLNVCELALRKKDPDALPAR